MPHGRTNRPEPRRTNGGLGLAVPRQAPSTMPARPGPALPPSDIPIARGGIRETGTAAAGQQAAQRPGGVPQFDTNPLGAIGFLLQQFAAGVQGRETPLTRLGREGREQQRLELENKALDLRAAGMALEMTRAGIAMLDDLSPDQHEALIATITVPEVAETLRAYSAGDLAGAKESAQWYHDNADEAAVMVGVEGYLSLSANDREEIDKLRRKQRFEIDTAVAKQAALAEGRVTQVEEEAAAGERGRESVRGLLPGATLLPSEEARELGFPEGFIVQRKRDGSFDVVAKPLADRTTRNRKITDTARQFEEQGMSSDAARQRAQAIVDGLIRFEIVPTTGQAREINEITGEVSEIPLGGPPGAAPETIGPTIVEMIREGGITGMAGAITEFGAATVGQFITFGPESQETVMFRQTIRAEQQNFLRALVVNPKFLIGEVNRLREQIKLEPSFFVGQDVFESRAKGIARSLVNRLNAAKADAGNPNLPEASRSAQAQNASAIRNFLRVLGADATTGQLIQVPSLALPDDDEALIQKYLR